MPYKQRLLKNGRLGDLIELFEKHPEQLLEEIAYLDSTLGNWRTETTPYFMAIKKLERDQKKKDH